MSSMTQKAYSDCSYPESDYDDVKSQISKVHERLVAVLQEEAQLRQSLEELFDKQEAEAMEELRKAEQNLKSIREERQAMRDQLKDKGSPIGNHKAVEDPVEEIEPPPTPLERNPTPAALIGNQKCTSDREQNYPLLVNDPEAQALSSKYGGNKNALELVAQMKEYERQAESFRRKVEETEPLARPWKELMNKYPSWDYHMEMANDYWSFASNKYQVTHHGQYEASMAQAEKDAAIIREILTHFEVPQEY